MTSDDILKLVDIAIELAATQLNKGDLAGVLVNMAQNCAQAYQTNMGQPLDPSLIAPAEEV